MSRAESCSRTNSDGLKHPFSSLYSNYICVFTCCQAKVSKKHCHYFYLALCWNAVEDTSSASFHSPNIQVWQFWWKKDYVKSSALEDCNFQKHRSCFSEQCYSQYQQTFVIFHFIYKIANISIFHFIVHKVVLWKCPWNLTNKKNFTPPPPCNEKVIIILSEHLYYQNWNHMPVFSFICFHINSALFLQFWHTQMVTWRGTDKPSISLLGDLHQEVLWSLKPFYSGVLDIFIHIATLFKLGQLPQVNHNYISAKYLRIKHLFSFYHYYISASIVA